MKIRLGTPGSRLARAQSGWVAARLEKAGHEVETVIVETRGDQQRDRPFAAIGQPGIFVRELERALEQGRIDLVVHSYKDLPSRSPEGLTIAAVPERLDPSDRLLVRAQAYDPQARGPLPLLPESSVGTASARRQALVLALRPDLRVGLLRGNVPTRIDKLRRGEHDAIVLASAGLERLDRTGGLDGRGDEIHELTLDPAVFVPAPSQGALALQVRLPSGSSGGLDLAVHRAVEALGDADATPCVQAERELLRLVEGGCNIPFGAWCERQSDGALHLRAVLGLGDGRLARAEASGVDPAALARAVARDLPSVRDLPVAHGERP